MCEPGCTHGQCVFIPDGYSFATWRTDDATTAAVQEALAEQGIERGTD